MFQLRRDRPTWTRMLEEPVRVRVRVRVLVREQVQEGEEEPQRELAEAAVQMRVLAPKHFSFLHLYLPKLHLPVIF